VADAEPRAEPGEHDWVFVGMPTVALNSDEGIGGGVTAGLYHYYGGTRPFRDDISFVVYITSRWIQRYELRWEGLDVLDAPVRIWLRAGYHSTVSDNFCGTGAGVSCSMVAANQAADALGVPALEEARAPFLRNYYQMRFIRLHGDLNLRWKLRDLPHKVELMAGYRPSYYIPGQIGDLTPYPGSLYAEAFPDGEPGLSSVLHFGFVFDDRDNEPAPNRGYFGEVSLRGASWLWASAWNYGGINTQLAGYFTVAKAPRLVLSSKVLADLMWGDVPMAELAQVGGTRAKSAFGGQWMGRGIRDHRYIGRLKVVHQSEVRTGFLHFDFIGFDVGLALAAFVDVGWVGVDWLDIQGGITGSSAANKANPLHLLTGYGTGLRVLINKSFVARFDVAFSPDESIAPGFYTPVGPAI
jgi:hypothetical protein